MEIPYCDYFKEYFTPNCDNTPDADGNTPWLEPCPDKCPQVTDKAGVPFYYSYDFSDTLGYTGDMFYLGYEQTVCPNVLTALGSSLGYAGMIELGFTIPIIYLLRKTRCLISKEEPAPAKSVDGPTQTV